MFKKIISLLLIAILIVSSIGMCSAKAKSTDIQIKFDNRNHIDDDQVIIYLENGACIYNKIKGAYGSLDRTFTFPKENLKKAKYMVVISHYKNMECIHHILLSDDFKSSIPNKITFRTKGNNLGYSDSYGTWIHEGYNLTLTLYNHEAYSWEEKTKMGYCIHTNDARIEYTFKKWN